MNTQSDTPTSSPDRRRGAVRDRIRRGVRVWNALLDAGAQLPSTNPRVREYPYPQG